ncbi:proline dehydrogenase [Halarchaeum grantii]|uniref:proline dehydrogenase n=1 Tax=Halarchaeum grantii TaxID=1193105 RepID=A0A830ET93_9EURY|nr:proline dehydrogenase family protein [Halarchaeum grantii]GGL28100.1 proline dehydrogenase [Halarchaeum grantii]
MIPPIASRFVAGETAAEALEHVESLNDRNVSAILNLLGEHYHERAPADADAETYRTLVSDITDANVDACLSVKPSQIGLGVGPDVFEENLGRIVEAAAAEDVFVWVDMEDHGTTDATLDAYERYAREYDGGVGVCVQANLRRTGEDLARLADVPGKVRLVKGAYDEPGEVAYRNKADVNERYRQHLEFLFREFDSGVAVGSHDPAMIEYARELHAEHGTPFEFQMLMGVREDAQFDLAGEYDVYQYVPYGGKWFQYFSRRMTERRENLLFGLRAILGR